jgi:hypothetical protein
VATLPNIPVNSAATLGVVAGLALIGYTATLRHKLDVQVHDNYRAFKFVDSGMKPEETNSLKLAQG